MSNAKKNFPDIQGNNREKIGKGNPPKFSQFKPGQSGNPGGRPKGRSITAQINKLIERGYKGKDVAEMLAKRALDLALAGDITFWREFVERHEGKIRDTLDMNVNVEPQYDWSRLSQTELKQFVELSRKARITE